MALGLLLRHNAAAVTILLIEATTIGMSSHLDTGGCL